MTSHGSSPPRCVATFSSSSLSSSLGGVGTFGSDALAILVSGFCPAGGALACFDFSLCTYCLVPEVPANKDS